MAIFTDAVIQARELFGIQEIPGNLFSMLSFEKCLKLHNILLFKEDIGKLSGFIGYSAKGTAIICINYKRPIGHQNFSFAHELGHWFMHKGHSSSDDAKSFYAKETLEKQANLFASELLYPQKNFLQDYQYIKQYSLLREQNYKLLSDYVDQLCHKYCLSFEFVLRKISYKANREYRELHDGIEKTIGNTISKVYDHDFYVPNDSLDIYQQSQAPYLYLERQVDQLVKSNKISLATAEAIKLRNGIDY